MRTVFRLVILLVGVVLTLAAAEGVVRVIDQPRPAPAEQLAPGAAVRRYVSEMPVADGVRREWLDELPAPLARVPLPPELQGLSETNRAGSDLFKRWNPSYLEEHVCSGDPLFQRFPGFAFTFQPSEPGIHPPYRFLTGVATPYGLVTNTFGFRGREIAADKPERTIRIAFAGASATVGNHAQAFSYPELIEPWLNRWAAAVAPGVRVEIINAAREGISSPDIAAIVRQEIAPLEPDVVFYYEGGNQFTPFELVQERESPRAPPAIPGSLPGSDHLAVLRRLSVFRRRARLGFGAEPSKPPYTLKWPASVSEAKPDPDSPELPLHLPQIVRDLDDIRRSSEQAGAKLVVGSFIWMVFPGMNVDPVDRPQYFDAVNIKLWPTTYADIRRMADFQNRVFAAYAAKRGVPFVDLAAAYPRDLSLFVDPVHMTLDGDRLRAWIVFQGLVPILSKEIAAGRLPRADRSPLALRPEPRLQRVRLECTTVSRYSPVDGALSVAALAASDEMSTVTGDRVKHLVTTPGRSGYAAVAPIGAAARVAGPGAVHVRLRVVSGRVAVGVLKPDQSAFVIYRTVEPGTESVDLNLPVPSMSDAGFLMISNAVPADGQRSVVDIEQASALIPK